MLVSEKYENPKVVVDSEELTRNINQKKKLVDVYSVTNAIGKSISSINIWNIVNQQ